MRQRRFVLVAAALGLFAATVTIGAQQVTFERILRADREPHNWLSYSGNYAGHRYSPLSQIDRTNVCLLYTSPSPRDRQKSRMPSSA